MRQTHGAGLSYDDTGILHILVIDDDPSMCEILSALFLSEGYLVVTADSAEKGLEQLPFYTFDVAFIDQYLPGMEGLVFGEYLGKNNPEMEIVLITGSPDDRLRRQCDEQGIHFLAKPFDPDAALAVVDRYLAEARDKHQASQQQQAPDYAPAIAEHIADVTAHYRMPGIPQRIEEQLHHRVRDAVTNLKRGGGDEASYRVTALAGLMAARVLGIKLPRTRDGETLYELYDSVMESRGQRQEFVGAPEEDDDMGPEVV